MDRADAAARRPGVETRGPRIARQQGWPSTYPAEYRAVTRLQADAIDTVDVELAAMARDLVPLTPLEALTADEDPAPDRRSPNRWAGPTAAGPGRGR